MNKNGSAADFSDKSAKCWGKITANLEFYALLKYYSSIKSHE